MVIVLTFLVVITGLVVAFLSSVTNEATATAASAAAVTTRSLADAAIQLDIAQIRDATAGVDSNGNTNGWASQPGAIHVFSTSFYPGSSNLIYKLYSAPVMRGTNAASNDLPASGWWNNTAQWIDLNSPVSNPTLGMNLYPIMDPSMTVTNVASGSINTNYVDGFSINGNSPTLSGCSNTAAMPVSWIYVLKNGTLTVPGSINGNVATFASNAPTLQNPIVGRIAFWTDDESCKLNVNTASEGVPWDPPTYLSLEDLAFQEYFPVGNEYNRVAGHPFSVCLSPVLWSYYGFPHPAALTWATPTLNSSDTSNSGSSIMIQGDPIPSLPSIISSGLTTSATNYANALFGNSAVVNGMLSRVPNATNGSTFGYYRTVNTNNRTTYTNSSSKSDRLYSTIDELAFSATNSSASSRGYNSTPLTPQSVSRLNFFLTTHSRAPEVNIFNLPRICLWPLNDTNSTNSSTVNPTLAALTGTARWSFLDQIIAQCSTLGTNAYYFTRFDPTSQTADFQGRNRTLYNYLASLLQTPMPGYASTNGGASSFATRWGVNACYEEATLCFDYIRSSINLVDSYGTATGAGGVDATATNIRYAYSYTLPPTNAVSNTASVDMTAPGAGQVVPIVISTNGITTRGMGRFPTLKSATMVFCAVAADQPPLMVDVNRHMTNATVANNAVNPLHPFVTTISSSVVKINFYENASSILVTNVLDGVTNISSLGSSILATNQFPCFYPTNGGVITLTTGVNGYVNATKYTNNLCSNVIVTYVGGVLTNVSTNSFQVANFNALTAAHGLTITHPGLVYGGDMNTNNTNFDLYNVYFSTVATVLGINASDTCTYTNQMSVSNNPITLKTTTNYTTASTSVTIPNTGATLFPSLYQTVMQPMFILNHALVSPGFAPYQANFKVLVSGLNTLTCDGAANPLFGPNNYGQSITNNSYGGANTFGPDLGLPVAISAQNAFGNMTNGTTGFNNYPFIGNFVKATNTASPNFGRTFQLGQGTITVTYLKPTASWSSYTGTTAPSTNDPNVLQQITMVFPGTAVPTPKLPPFNGISGANGVNIGTAFSSANNGIYSTNPTGGANNNVNFISPKYLFPSNSVGANMNSYTGPGGNGTTNMGWFYMPETWSGNESKSTANTFRSVEVAYGDWRLPSMMQSIGSTNAQPTAGSTASSVYTINSGVNLYLPHLLYYASNNEPTIDANFYWRSAHTLRGQISFYAYSDNGELYVSPGQFMQGLNTAAANGNDPGLIYGQYTAGTPSPFTSVGKLFNHINYYGWGGYPEALSTVDMGGSIASSLGNNYLFTNVWANGGDFDNPPGGVTMDGPYINKADEGTAGWTTKDYGWGIGAAYNTQTWASMGRARFSPNRQVPSSGMLGSLPAGFDPSNPSITNAWKSLVFSPNPNSSNRVSGMGSPPDYMIMDLFDMPVIQPYPISDPFSTAGRVNLNYQIAPFTYINRDSALRGVLKSVDLVAVPDSAANTYKYFSWGRTFNSPPNGTTNNFYYHYPIHLNQTLQQFTSKFATNGFFRSGAEICSVWLYPGLAPGAGGLATNTATLASATLSGDVNGTTSNIYNWWYANLGTTRKGLTGVNMRQRPYTAIYPNITTKSNTYQIHYRVQTLKQTVTAHGSDWSTWKDPASGGITDKVIAEQRGSAVIERYIDPNDPTIPDFASSVTSGAGGAVSISSTNSMDAYYRFRVFNAKQFTP